MAYRRETVFHTPLLSWQRLTLQAVAGEWSDDYRVDSPRLLLPATGCFECQLGPRRFVCDASTALWLTPAQTYRMRRPATAQRSVLLLIDADLGAPGRSALPLVAHLHLGAWGAAWSSGALAPLALEERIVALVQRTLPADAGAAARPHRAVERAREYIASAPENNDSLSEIASAVNCSPFHLARTFRRRTGQSLHRFRTGLRLAAAIERLRQGERDLTALALDLGYASHSHFSAVFRSRLGAPPSEMRRILTAPA
jgi:AraC family transcriptional regulator